MFAIIVSEKGGAERRESFDKNEINVGRVQGNDLMLPKGNVSKHHARLLFRDGRFIVTDLKSTNGTYVNGRKIAQATIVHDGDKIYIGDFVLRLEPSVVGVLPEPLPEIRPIGQPAPVAVTLKAPTAPPGLTIPKTNASAHPPAQAAENPPLVLGAETLAPGPAMAPQILATSPAPAPVSASPARASVAPPRIASTAPAAGQHLKLGPLASMSASSGASVAPAAPVQTLAPPPAAAVRVEIANRPKTAIPRSSTRDQAGRRLALQLLVGRVEDALGASLYARVVPPQDVVSSVEKSLTESIERMRADGEAPEGLDMADLERDARAEILGSGPIEKLLDDSRVSEVSCSRHDQVVVLADAPIEGADGSFTSERALRRAMIRLLSAADPNATEAPIVRRRHAQGLLICTFPPASPTPMFVLRKRRRADTTLEDLSRLNALSRPMAAFLESCVVGHANMLVVGGAAPMIVAGLTSVGAQGERIALVTEVDEVNAPHAHVSTLHFGDDRVAAEDVISAVRSLGVSRTVIMNMPPRAVGAMLENVADGTRGLIVSTSALTAKEALSHFVTSAGMTAPVDVVREAVASAFDVVIEVTMAGDRGPRIARISEIGTIDAKSVTMKDIFTFNPEGEGSFQPSGTTPRVVAELAQRGVKVDAGLFKRR